MFMAENCHSFSNISKNISWPRTAIRFYFYFEKTSVFVTAESYHSIPSYLVGSHVRCELVPSCFSNINMGDHDAAWLKYKNQMKQKRSQKKKADAGVARKIHQSGNLTVQCLSSEVSGKAQKFSRIGAREFVPI